MAIMALRPNATQLDAIRGGTLVHLSRLWRATKKGGMVRAILSRDEHSAVCEVRLRATRGLYKNLSVVDLTYRALAYTYFFLGDPGRLQIAVNVDNWALLPGWKPPPDRMAVRCRGADVLLACKGDVFYRPADKAVMIYGDYVGPAVLTPVPHELAVGDTS